MTVHCDIVVTIVVWISHYPESVVCMIVTLIFVLIHVHVATSSSEQGRGQADTPGCSEEP